MALREIIVNTVIGGVDTTTSEFPMRILSRGDGYLMIEERRWEDNVWYFRKEFAAGQWVSWQVLGNDRFAYFSK